MIRELFRIGSFAISPFGIMLVVAFVAAYLQLRSALRRHGVGDEEDASAIVFAAGVGGIVGGKIYYAILYGDWHLLFDRSGLVFYGGFILATSAVLFTIWRRRLPLPAAADAALLSVPLGYGIGRIGCFLVGDDYGVPTDLPWGVRFPVGLPPTTAYELRHLGVEVPAQVPGSELLAVHPTQLYETLLALAIWGIGLWALSRLRPGGTALLMLGLLSVERFGIEFLRAKDDRFFGHLTLAQVLALAFMVAACILWWRHRRRPGRT